MYVKSQSMNQNIFVELVERHVLWANHSSGG